MVVSDAKYTNLAWLSSGAIGGPQQGGYEEWGEQYTVRCYSMRAAVVTITTMHEGLRADHTAHAPVIGLREPPGREYPFWGFTDSNRIY